MGYIYDIDGTFTPRNFCRAVPGPVRHLTAVATFKGVLVLRWRPPSGGRVSSYRIERTREGRNYETLAEITGEGWFLVKDAPMHEPWFYRVTAVNPRGAGKFKDVWFFQRAGHGRSQLIRVPVMGGVRVDIIDMGDGNGTCPANSLALSLHRAACHKIGIHSHSTGHANPVHPAHPDQTPLPLSTRLQ